MSKRHRSVRAMARVAWHATRLPYRLPAFFPLWFNMVTFPSKSVTAGNGGEGALSLSLSLCRPQWRLAGIRRHSWYYPIIITTIELHCQGFTDGLSVDLLPVATLNLHYHLCCQPSAGEAGGSVG